MGNRLPKCLGDFGVHDQVEPSDPRDNHDDRRNDLRDVFVRAVATEQGLEPIMEEKQELMGFSFYSESDDMKLGKPEIAVENSSRGAPVFGGTWWTENGQTSAQISFVGVQSSESANIPRAPSPSPPCQEQGPDLSDGSAEGRLFQHLMPLFCRRSLAISKREFEQLYLLAQQGNRASEKGFALLHAGMLYCKDADFSNISLCHRFKFVFTYLRGMTTDPVLQDSYAGITTDPEPLARSLVNFVTMLALELD